MISAKRLHFFQLLLTLVCTFFVIVGVFLSYQQGLFKRADNFIYDLHIKWRGPLPTSGDLVLVFMDEKSAVELNKSMGSWSRRQLTKALDNLCKAGAEIVGLDLLLAAPDPDPQTDLALARTINECNNVVLARVSAVPGVGEITPLTRFQESMIGDGFIDVPLDEDGVLRRIRFFNAIPLADGGLQLLPAFALELVRSFLYIDYELDFSAEDHFVMGTPGGKQLDLPYPELLVNYHGDFNVFTNLSYVDVVNNRFPVESVKGKIVLVGSRLATQKDFFSTPFSRFNKETEEFKDKFETVIGDLLGNREPGVACHAHAVETILSQSFIRKVSTIWVAVLIVALGLVGLLFHVLRVGIVFETLLAIAGLAAIASVSHLVFLEKLLWLDIAPLFSIVLAQFVVGTALQKTFDRKKTALITSLFGKYVSPGVVSVLIKGDINDALEGHSQELTVLFSDLRGFTTLSERLSPKDTGILLNNYFDAMIPIVFKHQGTLDKLMGDAVMAFFGAPIAAPDHPVKAAKTALKMVEKLDTLRSLGIAGMENLRIGIGLNTGVATVGNLGSREFMDYTIIGDAVNLASRLEGINKVYGTNIILSEFTAEKLANRFLLRNLDKVKVKGKDKVVTIFELVGFRDSVEEKRLELVRVFESGLAAYQKMEWDHADECFSRALALFPADGPSRLYRERIIFLRQNPPQEGWNGVKTFDHK